MKEKEMSVIKNAEIITMGKEKKDCNSIAIENGKIKSIGHFSEMSGFLDSSTKIYDVAGMTVLPGFTDSHVHLFMAGLRSQQMELKDTRSFSDILDKILDWGKNHPEGDWICGWGVDDTKLKENRLPTAKDLDQAGINRPVWLLRFDGNASILNSEGIKKVKFNTDHSSALRDENGELTGIFLVPLNWDIRSQVLMNVGRDTLTDAAKWTADFACSNGITSLHPMEHLEFIPFLEEISQELPVRVHLYLRTDDINQVLKSNYRTIGGDMLIDGTFACYTAAVYEPYEDNPQEKGILYYEDKKNFLIDMVKKANMEGIQSAFHSIGDRGIGMHLEVLRKALGDDIKSHVKHRIEHFVLPTDDQIRNTAELGVFASVAPEALRNCFSGGMYEKRVGRERARKCLPLRTMFDHGIIVGGNSDAPVYKLKPLRGIFDAVNAPYENQRIRLMEALEMYTINGAKLALKENELGSIDVGKLADFVVLKENPFKTPLDRLEDIEVMMTIKGGDITYEKEKT